MLLTNKDIEYPMSADELNIVLEMQLLESEVQNATIHQPLSFSESLFYELWKQ